MDTNLLTQEQLVAINKADELLNSAALPTFTHTTEVLHRTVESARNCEATQRDNDKLLARLLDNALRQLRNNNPDGAMGIVQAVRDSLNTADESGDL